MRHGRLGLGIRTRVVGKAGRPSSPKLFVQTSVGTKLAWSRDREDLLFPSASWPELLALVPLSPYFQSHRSSNLLPDIDEMIQSEPPRASDPRLIWSTSGLRRGAMDPDLQSWENTFAVWPLNCPSIDHSRCAKCSVDRHLDTRPEGTDGVCKLTRHLVPLVAADQHSVRCCWFSAYDQTLLFEELVYRFP